MFRWAFTVAVSSLALVSAAGAQTHVRAPSSRVNIASTAGPVQRATPLAFFNQLVPGYYRARDPKAAVALVGDLLEAGAFDANTPRLRIIAFMAGLIANDPMIVRELVPLFAKLPGDQPMRLVRAIMHSGRPDWSLHAARLKHEWPERADEIEMIAKKGGRPIPTLNEDKNTIVVDMNWAYFGAAGNPAAIERIIAALPTSKAMDDPKHLEVAQAARWSLIDAAARSTDVLAICRRLLGGPQDAALRDVIAAAIDKRVPAAN